MTISAWNVVEKEKFVNGLDVEMCGLEFVGEIERFRRSMTRKWRKYQTRTLKLFVEEKCGEKIFKIKTKKIMRISTDF